MDVNASGYLPRATSVGSTSDAISLWPVSNEAEAEAVRAMVYKFAYAETLQPSTGSELLVTMSDVGLVPGALERWRGEAALTGPVFGVSYRFGTTFQYDQNEFEVFFRSPQVHCIPVPAWGFCRDQSAPGYTVFRVLPGSALDRLTIKRVLSSWFLGPNPLPGFMNADAPADEFSPLELLTIRMIRQRPLPNRWPDSDR